MQVLEHFDEEFTGSIQLRGIGTFWLKIVSEELVSFKILFEFSCMIF